MVTETAYIILKFTQRKNFLFFFFYILFIPIVKGVFSAQKDKEDIKTIQIWLDSAKTLIDIDIIKAKNLAENALKASNSINYVPGIFESKIELSRISAKQGSFTNAIDLAYNVLEYAHEKENKKYIYQASHILTGIYFSFKDYKKSKEYGLEVNKLSLNFKDTVSYVNSGIGLCLIYLELKDTVTALSYLSKSLSIAEKSEKKCRISFIHYIYGDLYCNEKDYNTSLFHLGNIKK